jgi:hypothetical protein
MGSQDATERQEKIKEKIEEYRKLMDVAYEIFDGKYTMKEIAEIPYKELLEKIEREQRIAEQKVKSNTARKAMKEMGM